MLGVVFLILKFQIFGKYYGKYGTFNPIKHILKHYSITCKFIK